MSGSLTLGEVTFNNFEMPEQLAIGGKQQLVIHSLPGGGRIVDAMGANEAPIRWSGVFSGQQAAERVRLVERLRRSGQRQLLTWNAWRYFAVIEEFEAQVSSSWWIPYTIKLCILTSDSSEQVDWLDRAEAPLLSVGLLGMAALESAVAIAALGLSSTNVGEAIASSGDLAQYVTARAYGMLAP